MGNILKREGEKIHVREIRVNVASLSFSAYFYRTMLPTSGKDFFFLQKSYFQKSV